MQQALKILPVTPDTAPIDNRVAACRLSGVSKTYQLGGTTIHALDDLSLRINEGEFVTIMGPSGSGKSTLLNLLGCIEQPDTGAVEILGQDVARVDESALTALRRDHIGFVFQNFSLIPVLSGFENVEYPLVLAKTPAAERRERVAAVLEAVGLADRAHHRPGELSGGQRQRVAIARALVKHPSLVIADEPTANVDSRTGEELLRMMRNIQETLGATFVVATHDPLVRKYATRRIEIADGRIAGEEIV